MGIRFLSITLPFFVRLSFKVTQEANIYQLVMRNHDFDVFWKKHPIFGEEMGVFATAHWEEILVNVYFDKQFSKISGLYLTLNQGDNNFISYTIIITLSWKAAKM